MKVKVEELQRTIDFLKKNGNPVEVYVELDTNLQSRLLFKATCNEELVTITVYDANLNVFPKRTTTERL